MQQLTGTAAGSSFRSHRAAIQSCKDLAEIRLYTIYGNCHHLYHGTFCRRALQSVTFQLLVHAVTHAAAGPGFCSRTAAMPSGKDLVEVRINTSYGPCHHQNHEILKILLQAGTAVSGLPAAGACS